MPIILQNKEFGKGNKKYFGNILAIIVYLQKKEKDMYNKIETRIPWFPPKADGGSP
jgi:hypothetical protein